MRGSISVGNADAGVLQARFPLRALKWVPRLQGVQGSPGYVYICIWREKTEVDYDVLCSTRMKYQSSVGPLDEWI